MKMLELKKKALDGGEFAVEYHVLKPGEHFPKFGGSSKGLVVGKTPSLITREKGPWGWKDTERDVHDPKGWHVIRWALSHPEEGWVLVDEETKEDSDEKLEA
jgi:hypothetical protein